MATLQTVRRWIMTGAVAAITVTGTIYGAGLKGQQELKQVCGFFFPFVLGISRACSMSSRIWPRASNKPLR